MEVISHPAVMLEFSLQSVASAARKRHSFARFNSPMALGPADATACVDGMSAWRAGALALSGWPSRLQESDFMNGINCTSAAQDSLSADGTDDFPKLDVLRDRDKRLAALKGVVAHLIHDFNNLLVPMAGYSCLLREHLSPECDGGPFADKMQTAFDKMEVYIASVLQATHPERRFSPRLTDLAGLLRKKLEAWMKGLPATAQITVQMDLVPCRFSLDESQWNTLVQHLLSNAQEALEEGGTLRVLMRLRTLTPGQAAGLGINDTSVYQLVFEDTGCGMSEETLERACEPFFSSRFRGQAAGLGLALAHSVVQLHGGQLSLESSEGLGTRVSLWLPANGV
jgi:signal transduction histidine kinase